MRKIAFRLILILKFGLIQGQQTTFNTLGFTLNGGLRGIYGGGGICLEHRTFDYLNINFGIGQSKHEGIGWGGGLRFFPLKYNKISPTINVNYLWRLSALPTWSFFKRQAYAPDGRKARKRGLIWTPFLLKYEKR
jgi:hypothetical protein